MILNLRSIIKTCVGGGCRSLSTGRARRSQRMDDTEAYILRNTEVSTAHLTPEIKLRLITPNCALWHAKEEDCALTDPFWGFYWPGGQALTRYILDHVDTVTNRTILDVGSGCGATAIACSMSGAAAVTANDICPAAAICINLNAKLNNTQLNIHNENLIGKPIAQPPDIVLLGDMFYDENFTNFVCSWVEKLHQTGSTVLIGDPGRLSLTKHPLIKRLQQIFQVELPEQCQDENNGLTHGYVWKYIN